MKSKGLAKLDGAAYYQTCTTFDAAPGVMPLLGEPAY